MNTQSGFNKSKALGLLIIATVMIVAGVGPAQSADFIQQNDRHTALTLVAGHGSAADEADMGANAWLQGGVQVAAGDALSTYFPLLGGDQKLFQYSGDHGLTMSMDDQGGGFFMLRENFGNLSEALQIEHEIDGYWIDQVTVRALRVRLDPSIELLNNDILQNGGVLSSETTVRQTGISSPRGSPYALPSWQR